MPEPISTVGGAAVIAYLSKDGISKLLGPTADYLGGEIKELVEKSKQNLASVFKSAEKKCGEKIHDSAQVNSRVFKHIYDEARFCENELFSEYFGGVLASSRTKEGVDDRGVYYTQIVQSLSSYQLRCHYLFYYLMWSLSEGSKLNLLVPSDRKKLTIIIPIEVYASTFAVTDTEKENSIISHSLSGLAKSDLINNNFLLEQPEQLKKRGIDVSSLSFVIEPTITGFELFNWAHGMGSNVLNSFFNPEIASEPDLQINLSNLARLKHS